MSGDEGPGEVSETSTGSGLTSGVDFEPCAGLDSESRDVFLLFGEIFSSSDGASEVRLESNENSENSSERPEEALLESRV